MRPRTQLLAAVLVPSVIADCSHNNCLRAVIGLAFPTRDGAGDCSRYLRVTVTPATSTFTATLTIPTLIVESSTVVDVSTQLETTVASTETDYAQETTVIEQTSTEVDVVATITRTVDPDGLAARQATAVGSTYPAYASPCSDFVRYSSACSCMGYYPDTITVAAPSTTITVASTQSSTSTFTLSTSSVTTLPVSVTETTLVTSTVTLSTDTTTTTSTTATAVATNIVKNGKFSTTSKLSPWILTKDNQITVSVANGVLKTGNMNKNNLFEMKQVLNGVAGTTYNCQYDWQFSSTYTVIIGKDPNPYVPYCHIYVNDDQYARNIVTPDYPLSPGVWYTATFQLTSIGTDTLWFDCASPQQPPKGTNYLQLDNISCIAAS